MYCRGPDGTSSYFQVLRSLFVRGGGFFEGLGEGEGGVSLAYLGDVGVPGFETGTTGGFLGCHAFHFSKANTFHLSMELIIDLACPLQLAATGESGMPVSGL